MKDKVVNKFIVGNQIIYYYEKPDIDEVSRIGMRILAGSGFENKRGLAHFTEHMIFNGTKKYPNHNALSEACKLCGNEFDGTTSPYSIDIKSHILNEKFFDALDLILDMVNDPVITSEAVEKERPIILQESVDFLNKMRRDYDELNNILFKPNRFINNLIGTNEEINEITYEDICKYWEDNFKNPYKKVLFISSSIPIQDIMDHLSQSPYITGSLDDKIDKFKEAVDELEFNDGNNGDIIARKSVIDTYSVIYECIVPFAHNENTLYALNIFGNMLSSGSYSIIPQELRYKKHMVYNHSINFKQIAANEKIHIRIFVDANSPENLKKIDSYLEKFISDPTYYTEDILDKIKLSCRFDVASISEANILNRAKTFVLSNGLKDSFNITQRAKEYMNITLDDIKEITENKVLLQNYRRVYYAPKDNFDLIAQL